MIMKTSEIKGWDTPLAQSEDNDCVVRALAAMSACTYDKAHAYAREVLGRKDKRGVTSWTLKKQIEEDGLMGKRLAAVDAETRYKVRGEVVQRQMTIKTFFKRAPQNMTFLVQTKGHIFCFKNGEVVGGNVEDAIPTRKRVWKVWVVVDRRMKKVLEKVAL